MNILDIAIAKKLAGGGGGSGTDNYNDLSNLPKINDTTLSGNKSSSALGLQSEINSDSKLASDLVDDTNQDNKFVTSTEKNTWNGKQNAIDADHKINADYVDDSTSTNKFVTASDKETWNAKQNAIDNSHKLSSDLVDDANHTNKFVTSTEKQTWNAKQNAIDADHKLSSSLVSFTDAEAAALASGIDSSKVGQISTNQTNILYALQTGVKNIIQLNPGTYTNNVATFTVSNDGEVVVNAGSAGTSAITIGEFELPAGDYKYWYDVTASSGKCDVRLMNGATRLASEFTLSSATTIHADVYSYAVNSNTVIKPMLCTANTWAQEPNVYRKPALPNYDLTRLEAEDRAALAEEIDAGAKNKFNLAGATITTGNASYTISGNSITVTSSGTWAVAYTPITLPAGDYVLDLDVTTRTSTTTNPKITIYTSTQLMDYAGSLDIKATGHYTLSFKSAGSTLYLAWYVNQSSTSSSTNTLTVTNMMVATKAAFGVSSAFVPYRYDPYTTSWQNVANGTLYARRNGRTVTINGYVDNVSFTAGSVTSLGTINNEIGKPVQQVRAICSIGLNAYTFGEPSYITIGTDGNVVVTPKTYSGTGAVFFSVSYTI